MCGICGVLRFDGGAVEKKEIYEMNQRMISRGPDDEGYYVNGEIGLGMRRLSIIDLSGGHQPMSNEDGRFCVILNGEIYNYVELRDALIQRGHIFRTHSDTEVIVHLYEEKGPDCVLDLNGMFAFAVWDEAEKSLFICRDRIGIKPLFYAVDSGSFVFCSDLSGITAIRPSKKEIDFSAFLSYLGMSYLSSPQTIFKDVYKLEPAHFIKISRDGTFIKKKYWDIDAFETLQLPSVSDYCDRVLTLFRDSIRLQMRSDVPIGTFLSGGMDSSSVVALLSEQVQPVRTFSVGFQGGVNELPYARLVADKFRTEHFETLITPDDVLSFLPEIISKMDEPVSDNAIVPTLILSKAAISKGIKVILNGTGGDELFGGYDRYLPQRGFWKRFSSLPLPLKKLAGGAVRYFDSDRGMRMASPELFFMASVSGVNFSLAERLLKNKTHYDAMLENVMARYQKVVLPSNAETKMSSLMALDLKDYLAGDILSLLDKMTMAVSLEGRVPFLDHRLVELCFQIPASVKFMNGRLKGLLKTALKDILPQELFNLPKAGFGGPTKYWVHRSLNASMKRHLSESPIAFYEEYLNLDAAKNALANTGKYGAFSETLFSLYIFSLWHQKHIEGKEPVV